MAIETERRFLVDYGILCDSFQYVSSDSAQLITQFYLSTDPECTVRVRQTKVAGIKSSVLTVKGKRVNGSCPEIEFDIPNNKGNELTALGSCSLMKKRLTHPVTTYGLSLPDIHWEIDIFDEALNGLVIAEVEVPDIALPIDLPIWIGREITEDNTYSNSALAKLTPDQIQGLKHV